MAQTLIEVVSGIEEPTLRDLLRHVGEGGYDLELRPPPVDLGTLTRNPGLGPTVRQVLEVLDLLGPDPLELAQRGPVASRLDRPLSEFVPLSLRALG
ncbi:hypothetical protein DB30_03574 [Enhygromyxa salina]|uniref:Uncharacterized protein n=1 Tax=Enhygromyxa salina TaxID=215803 RepID=A0A0C1ZLA9_9BACT|nr:hypothetical protein [Enhygromyxa salina]KIG11518.1 hypothetical protein DB30_03574 [Enhygromyxa salina]